MPWLALPCRPDSPATHSLTLSSTLPCTILCCPPLPCCRGGNLPGERCARQHQPIPALLPARRHTLPLQARQGAARGTPWHACRAVHTGLAGAGRFRDWSGPLPPCAAFSLRYNVSAAFPLGWLVLLVLLRCRQYVRGMGGVLADDMGLGEPAACCCCCRCCCCRCRCRCCRQCCRCCCCQCRCCRCQSPP